MKENAELLSSSRNFAVVQLPGRKFPGVVFQGDSLNILLRELKELQQRVATHNDDEINARLEDLTERMSEVLRQYETVCAEKGIPLPYPKSPMGDQPP